MESELVYRRIPHLLPVRGELTPRRQIPAISSDAESPISPGLWADHDEDLLGCFVVRVCVRVGLQVWVTERCLGRRAIN